MRNSLTHSCVRVCLVPGFFPKLITVSERQQEVERGREIGKSGKEAGGRSPGKPLSQQ